ncbi:ArsB/NhaD family transporter [Treponema peruense]|uniref:TRAP transporter large permease subunit n=1 Tax=Treponema peruense TaxID=2787628 RepID=A0A7T3V5F3_9SPIR|nr:SLC13 family permease [Treponema peruense]QQA01483.1 TRAP transporter large permease subunit [Treponema peruense]
MEQLKWVVLAIAVVMYALVIAFQKKKVWFTSIAAILVIILGMIFPGGIFSIPEDILALEGSAPAHMYSLVHAFLDIINWNVILIYLGSMIIAALFIYSKVPVKIADAIVSGCKNTGIAMVAILAMTGIISIFVENVATVLVMAPIALALCKKLKIDPTFFMIGLAVMSNLEGTATLVGDPPSMIFASYAGYSFNDFFVHQNTLSIFFIVQTGMLAGCIFFYCFFAKNGKNKIESEGEPVVSWVPLVLLLLMIFGLAGVSFIHTSFEYTSGILVAILGLIGLLWYKFVQKKSADDVRTMVKELDWETIFFLLGIFVVIGGIRETGLLNDFAVFLAGITGGSKLLGFVIILVVSIVISGFVDNVPYIIAMLPVAESMAKTMELKPELFMFALLVGSCLGGNLTPFGASANIVAMGIVKKEGYPMKFSGWLKVGVPFTLITTTAAALLLWVLWS